VDEIKKIYGNNTPVVLAANLGLPPLQQRTNYEKKIGELKICCVTRLVRNKKIDFALEIIQEIKEGKIEFNIYGPVEDEIYYRECLEQVKKLPKNISVSFKGTTEPKKIEGVLQEHQVFLLPTLTENFGHAILESMVNGCIPVISNQTPWQNLQKNGLGWDIALSDKPAFMNVLKQCLLMDEAAFKSQSIKIQHFASDKTASADSLKAYKQLFK